MGVVSAAGTRTIEAARVGHKAQCMLQVVLYKFSTAANGGDDNHTTLLEARPTSMS